MDQRVDVVTVGVRDLDASRRFYLDGLGWQAVLDVPGEVIFMQVAPGLLPSLWDVERMAGEVGEVYAGPLSPPFGLAHNVGDTEVSAVLERAVAPARPWCRPRLVATGVASAATSPTLTASAGRWRTTPA